MVKRPAKKHLQSIPIEAMQSVSVPCDDKFHTKDACEITRGLLYGMEYGYSMDDLTVELERFMKDRSFTAIEYNDEDLEDVSRFF